MIAAAAPAAAGGGSRLDDDGAVNSGKETHSHDDAQHGVSEGHLQPTSNNVTKVGNIDLFAGAEEPGGNYA